MRKKIWYKFDIKLYKIDRYLEKFNSRKFFLSQILYIWGLPFPDEH